MDRDTAKIILGEWLQGEHKEDIKLIPPAEFGDLMPVAKMIRAGETNPVKIAKSNRDVVDLGEVSQMQAGAYSALYESAMWSYIDSYRASWLKEHPNASPQDIISFVEKTQRDWMVSVPDGRDITDVTLDYLEVLDARRERKVTMTGVHDLDELSGGIAPGTLTAIGARPGTGKSAFCLQTAVNVAMAGHKVLYFSLEMTEAQNMDRLMMMFIQNGINQKDLRDGKLDNEQMDKIGLAINDIKTMQGKLIFSQEREVSAIRRMIDKHKPDLAIIDQLSQMSDRDHAFISVRERFSHMTRNLMDMSKNSTTAIWLACQVNRDANDSKPSLANLKESGSIEEDCDMVILLSRDKDEEEQRGNMNGNRVINVEVAKYRNGEPGEFKLKFVVKRFGFQSLEVIPPGFIETQEEISF